MVAAVDHSMAECQADQPPPGVGTVGLTTSIGRTIGLWRSRIRERHAIGSFDYRDLRDLGLSRWDAERELSKPFWRG